MRGRLTLWRCARQAYIASERFLSADFYGARGYHLFVNVGGLHALGSETDRDEACAHPARERRAFEQP